MAEYKTFLAANILTEEKSITYRLLSRALKVPVNAAKEMLFEFHNIQNAKRPGTVHATYLISGTLRTQASNVVDVKKDPDGDDYMQSSPFMSSSIPQPEEHQSAAESSVLSITLVKEEDLAQIRSEYEHINSIHIYSLMPHPLKDLQILSDVNRELLDLCASEDPLESLSKYGTITNPNVRRRKAGANRPHPATVTAQINAQPAKTKPAEPKLAPKDEPKGKPSNASEFFGKGKEKPKTKSTAADNSSSKESTPNPPTLKRESSSLMKSFAKAKPKLERKGTESSAASPAVSAAEDSPMKDVSDDEEENFVPPPSKAIVDSNRQTRKEREAALRAMMEDDDEDEPAAPTKVEEPEEEEEEAEKVPEPEPEHVEPKDEVVVIGGRRRGRRRVMQKKKIEDEDGYLVTKQEMGWESFSEDDPVAKPKPKPHPAATATKKKPAAKPNQGNIMSFFGKK